MNKRQTKAISDMQGLVDMYKAGFYDARRCLNKKVSWKEIGWECEKCFEKRFKKQVKQNEKKKDKLHKNV